MGQAKTPGYGARAAIALRRTPPRKPPSRTRAIMAARRISRPPRTDLAHQHFGTIIVSCERADLRPMPNGVMIYAGRRSAARSAAAADGAARRSHRRTLRRVVYGTAAAARRRMGDGDAGSLPRDASVVARGPRHRAARTRSRRERHARENHPAPLARGRPGRPPRASRQGRDARARARAADAPRRARGLVRPLDLPAHSLGGRRADAARIERRGRRDASRRPSRRSRRWSGSATSAAARDDRKKVYVFLTPQGPRAEAHAGAARRGGQRGRGPRRARGRHRGDARRAARHHRESRARGSRAGQAHALDPRAGALGRRVGQSENGRANAPRFVRLSGLHQDA